MKSLNLLHLSYLLYIILDILEAGQCPAELLEPNTIR